MDAYSSGEELVVKTRKPYTITKQRERWTEVEHNRFLEALKLYGRAWQRIEEHIGTKTAVQIRSHAQKFFSKLEKEALVKGVPVAQAIDIEIPPPRPKRKPSNPYPRKTGIVGTTNAQVRDKDVKPATSESPQTGKHVLDLEKEPLPEKPVGDERQQNTREDCDDEKNSESGAIFQETPSNEGSSFAIRSSVPNAANVSNSCNFMEFVPLVNNVANKEKPDDSHIRSGPNEDHISSKPDVVDSALNNGTDTEMQGTRSFPRHVPVHVLDASLGASTQAMSSDVSYQDSRLHHIGIPGHPAFFPNPAMSATGESQNSTSRSTNHHMFPSFHPFAPFVNSQDDYNSFLQMSTTVSSLVVSTLLQNPAAHAAASFAASFWPSANTETSADSPAGTINGFPPRPMNPTPSMAAIAAATVAAATAWWAAHGLLPVCAPPNTEFACAPASATNVTLASPTGPALSVEKEREVNGVQKPDQESSKSPETSSSDSGDSLGAKIDSGLTGTDNEKKTPVSDEQKDANQGKCKKQVDRSSCGSNTPSGSDIETDALEKNEKENEEEPKEPDVSNEPSEFSNRRNRYTSNANETWKEVSEEGRLAFQALFSREVLPQSFSPRNNTTNLDPENPNANDITRNPPECPNDDLSRLDLSTMTYEPSIEKSTQDESNVKDSPILTINMKTRKTGFKPYKRCSVEARETRVTNTSNQEQEKCAKRIRLQGEAST